MILVRFICTCKVWKWSDYCFHREQSKIVWLKFNLYKSLGHASIILSTGNKASFALPLDCRSLSSSLYKMFDNQAWSSILDLNIIWWLSIWVFNTFDCWGNSFRHFRFREHKVCTWVHTVWTGREFRYYLLNYCLDITVFTRLLGWAFISVLRLTWWTIIRGLAIIIISNIPTCSFSDSLLYNFSLL